MAIEEFRTAVLINHQTSNKAVFGIAYDARYTTSTPFKFAFQRNSFPVHKHSRGIARTIDNFTRQQFQLLFEGEVRHAIDPAWRVLSLQEKHK
jgi:hypothetical protein